MKKWFSAAAASLLVVLMPVQGHTQDAVVNFGERRSDIQQIETAEKILDRDKAELEAIIQVVGRLDEARSADNEEGLQAAYRALLPDLKRELGQARAMAEAAQKEVRQSGREVRAARRDVREADDEDEGEARQRAQARDDQRDRRDDRQDRDAAIERTQRAAEILGYLTSAEAPPELAHVDRIDGDRVLLDEFIALQRETIGAIAEELEEDRNELQEDRRERRTDRRN